jgi:hypothetical protein
VVPDAFLVRADANFRVLFDLFDSFRTIYDQTSRSCGRARCILAHPVEDQFYRPRTRCILARPAGQIAANRTPTVYSATEERFSAPIFCAPVGDALSLMVKSVVENGMESMI